MDASASLCGVASWRIQEAFHVLPSQVLRKTLESQATILCSLRKKGRSTTPGHPVQDGDASFSVHSGSGGGGAEEQLVTELNVFIDRP